VFPVSLLSSSKVTSIRSRLRLFPSSSRHIISWSVNYCHSHPSPSRLAVHSTPGQFIYNCHCPPRRPSRFVVSSIQQSNFQLPNFPATLLHDQPFSIYNVFKETLRHSSSRLHTSDHRPISLHLLHRVSLSRGYSRCRLQTRPCRSFSDNPTASRAKSNHLFWIANNASSTQPFLSSPRSQRSPCFPSTVVVPGRRLKTITSSNSSNHKVQQTGFASLKSSTQDLQSNVEKDIIRT